MRTLVAAGHRTTSRAAVAWDLLFFGSQNLFSPYQPTTPARIKGLPLGVRLSKSPMTSYQLVRFLPNRLAPEMVKYHLPNHV